ncbi:5-carboxymethyl-2-hydroxymuconate semialdehyde dehydrogenase [Metabacillus sp. 113a]|uniref:5-carboxymethyl-2-hydroxymuconate semialdehyde dehydrogenase n=1 Tax=Metabacillus sp. 113a TaxID=3404706 RepID=UPI003CEA6C31
MTIQSKPNAAGAEHKQLQHVKHYINGKFIKSEQTFENVNPYTNQIINHIAEGRKQEMDLAVSSAKRAFEEGPWGFLKLEKRMAYMEHIAALIEEEIEELSYLESLDTGLPISQTRKMASRAAENFRFYSRMVQTKLHGEAYTADDQFLNYTVYKPLGPIGLITPWNAPFMLETWKIAPALATGNTVILKPAELSPLTAGKLSEIIHKAELPPGVFNVVHGFGETAGAALVSHPDVKAISFTGETKTGSIIIKNAADTLKKTSMELGGKSPLIVFEDADTDRALDAAVWGIFSFNGERCTANSRLLLHKDVKSSFVEKLKERIENIVMGDPLNSDTQLGPLIGVDHCRKVKRYIELAEKEGCDVVQGTVPENLMDGNFVPPTLLLNARNEMRVCQEEIFGPVMSVIEFETEEEAIRLANSVPYGLAGYVWTNDLKRGHRVAQAVEAGMLWINSHNVRDLRIPFGGMKASGIGREGGHYAIFEFYCEPKVIHTALGNHHIPQFGKRKEL